LLWNNLEPNFIAGQTEKLVLDYLQQILPGWMSGPPMLNGNGHSPQKLHKNAFKVMSGTVPFEGQIFETHAVSFVGTPAMFPEPVGMKNWLM